LKKAERLKEKNTLKYAHERLKVILKLAAELSAEGIFECVLVGTMKAPQDGTPEEIEETCIKMKIPEIEAGQWTRPVYFSTAALAKIVPVLSNNKNLEDNITRLASDGTSNRHVFDADGGLVDVPVKSHIPPPATVAEARKALEIMRTEVESFKKYLCQSNNYKTWPRKRIMNYTASKTDDSIPFLKGLPVKYRALDAVSDVDVATIWYHMDRSVTFENIPRTELDLWIGRAPTWPEINPSPSASVHELDQTTHDSQGEATATHALGDATTEGSHEECEHPQVGPFNPPPEPPQQAETNDHIDYRNSMDDAQVEKRGK